MILHVTIFIFCFHSKIDGLINLVKAVKRIRNLYYHSKPT